ncbi:MAG: hypothetical protein VR65_26420 [Desulfobulbaceae bacterium BRH_c16a]|nr:MAG: hypothetical protein VR65_26420 [Desulfobulbaceae bacterium BRH_c16a]
MFNELCMTLVGFIVMRPNIALKNYASYWKHFVPLVVWLVCEKGKLPLQSCDNFRRIITYQ